MNTEPEKKQRKKPVTHSYKTELAAQKKVTRIWQFVAAGFAAMVVALLIIYV